MLVTVGTGAGGTAPAGGMGAGGAMFVGGSGAGVVGLGGAGGGVSAGGALVCSPLTLVGAGKRAWF